jgi:hypothetical protein
MNDDDLAKRLSRALQVKADQVRETNEVLDPTVAVATLDVTPATHPRGRRLAFAAAIVVVLLGVAAGAGVVLRNRTDATPASPFPVTTSGAVAVTTTPTTATTPTTVGSRVALALEGWNDSPDGGPDGTVAVDRFNALLETHQPDWQGSPVDVAVVFSHLTPDATSEHADLATSEVIESSTRERVQVTLTGIGDDSIAAERYGVELVRGDLGWRLQSAQWSQRCQPRRGHQDFTTELCV